MTNWNLRVPRIYKMTFTQSSTRSAAHLHLAHLQLLDSALPIGAFSHSFGLETLVQNGTVQNANDLEEYARTMLFGAWSTSDAMAIKGVYLWTPHETENVWQLDEMLHVSRSARETREGLQKMGKRLLHLGMELHPNLNWTPLTQAIENGLCVGTHATVYGWMTHGLGVPLDDAAQGYLYNCAAATINSAVRLMALGQTRAQTLLAGLLPQIDEAWLQVAGLEPFNFSTSTPSSEIAMMNHETLYSRLFMS
jgi:urease accessory protein